MRSMRQQLQHLVAAAGGGQVAVGGRGRRRRLDLFAVTDGRVVAADALEAPSKSLVTHF